jgi:hypothetical protein
VVILGIRKLRSPQEIDLLMLRTATQSIEHILDGSI